MAASLQGLPPSGPQSGQVSLWFKAPAGAHEMVSEPSLFPGWGGGGDSVHPARPTFKKVQQAGGLGRSGHREELVEQTQPGAGT